jgi:fructosamine-3-kinase
MNEKFEISGVQDFIATVPGFKDCVVRAVDGGVSTEVYKLTRGDDAFYLRIAPENESMASEALAHRLLLEKGVQVPQVLVSGDKNNILGRSYLVTSEIAGAPYSKESIKSPEVIFEAGKQLALINSIHVRNFGSITQFRIRKSWLVIALLIRSLL